METLSDPDLVFLEDNRHVKDDFVAYIIFRFLTHVADFEFDKSQYIDDHIHDPLLKGVAESLAS